MDAEAEEMLQVVDTRGRFLWAASRAECHADSSLIHRSVCVLLFNAAGELYIQRRAMDKDLYAGLRDLSASGHVRIGETEDNAAARELSEELGVRAPIERVQSVLLRLPEETEHATIYRCKHDGVIIPDRDELAGGEFYGQVQVARLPDLTPYALGILTRLEYI
ncbi:MAG: NUDIX domain-containing protein [Chloroflexia bacterium]|nr:NUDIX domain-containing protein [Chloroflexia bacterium]